jgi:DNA-binding transcriptional LysR family regulator
MSRLLDETMLIAFLEAARTGSLGAAAKKLGRSQPLLTHYIRRLEDILGCTLFDRTSRGVSLTAEGQELLPYVQRLVSVSDDAIRRLGRHSRERGGQIRIRLSEDLAGETLLRALAENELMPNCVDLQVLSAGQVPPLQVFESGEVDMFLGDPSPALSAVLKPVRVLKTQLVWAASPRFQPSRSPLPLAMYPEDCNWRAPIAEAFDSQLIAWTVAVETSSLSALHAAARSGIAMIGCLHLSLGEGLVVLDHVAHELPQPPEIEIAHYRSPRRRPSPQLQALETSLWDAISGASFF